MSSFCLPLISRAEALERWKSLSWRSGSGATPQTARTGYKSVRSRQFCVGVRNDPRQLRRSRASRGSPAVNCRLVFNTIRIGGRAPSACRLDCVAIGSAGHQAILQPACRTQIVGQPQAEGKHDCGDQEAGDRAPPTGSGLELIRPG